VIGRLAACSSLVICNSLAIGKIKRQSETVQSVYIQHGSEGLEHRQDTYGLIDCIIVRLFNYDIPTA
jgi:hypothetical protein